MLDKYEADRIGNGKVGTIFGLVKGVGGPDKHEYMDHDKSTKASKQAVQEQATQQSAKEK
jgi:hypothetical protein